MDERPTTLRVVPPSDYSGVPSLYANFVQITMSPHDFRLMFSHYAFPPMPEPRPAEIDAPVQPLVTVTIPLNLMKGLIRALETQVDKWEEGFREPVPDQPQPEGALNEGSLTGDSEGTS